MQGRKDQIVQLAGSNCKKRRVALRVLRRDAPKEIEEIDGSPNPIQPPQIHIHAMVIMVHGASRSK